MSSPDFLSDFVTVPAGTYLCCVAEVRAGTTRSGDERWSLLLRVADGSHVGRMAAWDSVVFSARGLPRARRVLGVLGLPCTGTLDCRDLIGRTALVEVRPAEYATPDGAVVRRNEVPYDGWRPDPRAAGEPDPSALGVPQVRPSALAELGRRVLAVLSADDGADGGDRLAAIVRDAVALRLGEEPDDAGESCDPWLRPGGRAER